ncbi:SCO1664 family protein [Jatrophihabitans sp. DSM 45814]
MGELTAARVMPAEDALVLLDKGELTIEGRVTTASNATLYCRIELDGFAAACVYKPVAGERPLWDYPDGTLAEREYATYLVGAATGWDPVPPTVLREGPMGAGMVQLWIEDDDDYDLIAAINSGKVEQLRRMALLDAVVNNSDRKVSHLLPIKTSAGQLHVYGIDHGVSFGTENKLRTVLWQWAGVRIEDADLAVLSELSRRLDGDLGDRLSDLLTTAEVRATRRRVRFLIQSALFPLPPTDWPAVPYPPY